jgi:hypothetical protein
MSLFTPPARQMPSAIFFGAWYPFLPLHMSLFTPPARHISLGILSEYFVEEVSSRKPEASSSIRIMFIVGFFLMIRSSSTLDVRKQGTNKAKNKSCFIEIFCHYL